MCCLFGLIDYGHTLSGKQKSRIISTLATACEVRGKDATGIAYNNNGKLCVYKRPLPASLMRFKIPAEAHVIMGHTRMTTQGSAKKNHNNHPFLGQAGDDTFALAHNGVLWNDYELRREKLLPGTKIETDSYIAVQLVEQQKALNPQSLKNMAEELEGSFCFTVLDKEDNLYVVKGDNPICIYHWPGQQIYLYASTEEILKAALAKMPVTFGKPHPVLVSEGWILKITCDAVQTMTQFDATKLDTRWYYYSRWPVTPPVPKTPSSPVSEYINELKRMAERLGFSGREVDALLSDGFTADEVADFLYEGAF